MKYVTYLANEIHIVFWSFPIQEIKKGTGLYPVP
jgi:hypothetical protein